MGVKTVLAGLTFTPTGKSTATAAGVDLAGMIAETQMKCQEAVAALTYLVTDVLTPAGTESSNITTINTQITNLS